MGVRRVDVKLGFGVTRLEGSGSSFDFIHLRAVLMHLDHRLQILRRVVSWLAPGGSLLVEEPDFGMWQNDADPVWSAHPRAWHEAFPSRSLWEGRALLRQMTSDSRRSTVMANSTSSDRTPCWPSSTD